MAVRRYVRAKDGRTVYSARFLGPDGREIVRKVRVVKPDARPAAHKNAESAARAYAEGARDAIENGTWEDPQAAKPAKAPLSFERLVRRFLRDYRPRSGRIDYYKERSKAWLTFFKGPAKAVTVADVDRFRRARSEKVADGTVRKDLVSLSLLFEWGKKRGLVDVNPADHKLVKRPPKTKPDPHPLTKGEELKLLEAAPEWLEPVIEFAIETGVDRAEILALSWTRHVDRERRVIHLARGKTGVGRSLPYRKNARLRLILARARRVRAVGDDPVFMRDGGRVKLHAANTALRRAWKRAEISKPRPWKSLRATFASRRAEQGVDVPSIAALMGLTTAHVLEHYIKPSGSHLVDAMSSPKRARPARAKADEATSSTLAAVKGST